METSTTKIATAPERRAGDRLSSLPDDILSHILSFLQTKYAVGTAVLSRRWKDVWTRVSSLDLDDSVVYHQQPPNNDTNVSQNMLPGEISKIREMRRSAFSRFVGRVLSQHQNLDSVRRFRLQVMSTLSFKMELGSGSLLEEIDLELRPEVIEIRREFQLPESFYALKNLKVLKLYRIRIANTDGSVFLPNLKILQLLRVQAKDCESFRRLISDCPVLETVHMERCYPLYREQAMLIVSSPSLKNLTVIDRGYYNTIGIVSPSLEYLHLDLHLGLLSNLVFLGGSTVFPCLASAWVDIVWGPGDSYHRVIELLNQISNAKRIHWLSRRALGFVSVVNNGVQPPVFPNWTHLTMEAPMYSSLLHYLLNSVSKLQFLAIDMGRVHWKRMTWESEPACTPECLLPSLEEIVIGNLAVAGDDTKLVGYLLKFAAVLKKVTVRLLVGPEKNDRRGLASLLKLPRKSSSCQVHFLLPDGDEFHPSIDDEFDTDDDDEVTSAVDELVHDEG